MELFTLDHASPSRLRSSSNWSSSLDPSIQVRSTSVLEFATATRSVGAPGGLPPPVPMTSKAR